jgi:mersacidin/lichenicidin family type 2 lantibiotic
MQQSTPYVESPVDVVRAWKDSEYAKSLSPNELANIPENPAGSISSISKPETESVLTTSFSCYPHYCAPLED